LSRRRCADTTQPTPPLPRPALPQDQRHRTARPRRGDRPGCPNCRVRSHLADIDHELGRQVRSHQTNICGPSTGLGEPLIVEAQLTMSTAATANVAARRSRMLNGPQLPAAQRGRFHVTAMDERAKIDKMQARRNGLGPHSARPRLGEHVFEFFLRNKRSEWTATAARSPRTSSRPTCPCSDPTGPSRPGSYVP
jgi:hypothetical protein